MSISEYAAFMKHSNNTKMNSENILTYISTQMDTFSPIKPQALMSGYI